MKTTEPHTVTTDTTAQAEALARGILAEKSPGHMTLAVPDSSYAIHLVTEGEIAGEVGRKIRGVIRAQARRIDKVKTGGRYLEPVIGRPRRVQGLVIATDPAEDTVTVRVHDAIAIICRTDGQQRAAQFEVGDFVSFDVLRGATFEPGA